MTQNPMILPPSPSIFVECLCGIAVLSSVSCGVCWCSFV